MKVKKTKKEKQQLTDNVEIKTDVKFDLKKRIQILFGHEVTVYSVVGVNVHLMEDGPVHFQYEHIASYTEVKKVNFVSSRIETSNPPPSLL